MIRRCYSVLPAVSHSYPDPRGRLPTRYSPLRRSSIFLQAERLVARLACLIHAANVHSEPGSNPSIGFALPNERDLKCKTFQNVSPGLVAKKRFNQSIFCHQTFRQWYYRKPDEAQSHAGIQKKSTAKLSKNKFREKLNSPTGFTYSVADK